MRSASKFVGRISFFAVRIENGNSLLDLRLHWVLQLFLYGERCRERRAGIQDGVV